jgi:hypothetical protein
MEEQDSKASSSIKVIKLSSGEELISMVDESPDEVVLSNPAKIVFYTTSTPDGEVIECLRVTSYLANIKETSITILMKHVIYLAEPSEDILNMYNSYLEFMNGLKDDVILAEIEPDHDNMDVAWALFSDPQFIDFVQEIYEEHLQDSEIDEEEDREEPSEELFDSLNAEWEKAINENRKKRKYKKEDLKLPYIPDNEASDPQSWSDNPEDYLT